MHDTVVSHEREPVPMYIHCVVQNLLTLLEREPPLISLRIQSGVFHNWRPRMLAQYAVIKIDPVLEVSLDYDSPERAAVPVRDYSYLTEVLDLQINSYPAAISEFLYQHPSE